MTNLWMKLQLQDNKTNAVSDREADQEKTADEINKLTEGGIKSRDILREKKKQQRKTAALLSLI